MLVGLVVALAGTAVLGEIGPRTSYWWLSLSLVVRGVGLGATMMPAMAAAYQTLSRAAVPRATTALNITQRVGGSVGTALLAVVLERRIHAELPQVPGAGLGALSGLAAGARDQVAGPLSTAFGQTFWVAFVLTAVSVLPALFLPMRPFVHRPHDQGDVPGPAATPELG